MARNIAGRLKRIEKLTLNKNDDWVAIVEDDTVKINMIRSNERKIMTLEEFEAWKHGKAEGITLEVVWAE